MRLDQLPWPEVEARAASTLLVVPVGSTEQHGPHLPLSTDTDIASALCAELAGRRPDVLVAPALAYGAAGEHAGFAGTLSIGAAVTEEALVELGRSADAFAGVLFVSAHGGNASAVAAATRRLESESRRVRAWSPRGPGGADAHAGRTETSVMLALHPDAVREQAAVAGGGTPLRQLLPELQAGGVRAVSPNGVLGDPAGSSARRGQMWLADWADALEAAIEGWP